MENVGAEISLRASDRNLKLVQGILGSSDEREKSLSQLVLRRSEIRNLGSLLWGTKGIVASLLADVFSAYPFLSCPDKLEQNHLKRVLDVLVLFQMIALDETNLKLIESNICLYFFPFLDNHGISDALTRLRLAVLGIFGNLLRDSDQVVVEYLLNIEFLPLLLKVLLLKDKATTLVALFILKKLLNNANVIKSLKESVQKIETIVRVMNSTLIYLIESPNEKIEALFVECYECILNDDIHQIVKDSLTGIQLESSENNTQAFRDLVFRLQTY